MDEQRLADIIENLNQDGAHRFAPDEVELVARVPILWSAWECDHTAWLVMLPDGSRRIVIENATRDMDPIKLLLDRIAAYREAITATEALLTQAGAFNMLATWKDAPPATGLRERLAQMLGLDDLSDVPGLPAVVEALRQEGCAAILDFLVSPDSVLGDRSPLAALRAGMIDEVMRLVRQETEGDGFS